MQGGLVRSLRLTHTGAETFLTLHELMAANLRAVLAAYAGLWTFPPPAEATDSRQAICRSRSMARLHNVQDGSGVSLALLSRSFFLTRARARQSLMALTAPKAGRSLHAATNPGR